MAIAEDKQAGAVAWAKRLWPLLLLLAAMALVFAMGWHRYLTLQELVERREALRASISGHTLLAILAFMAIYAATVALSLPGAAVLTLAGGFLFGWFWGALASVAAATLGAIVIFLIARSALGEPLAARAGPWLAKLRAGFKEDAFNYLLFLRLVPIFPFWLVNLAPALLGVSLWTYTLATVIGIVPGSFAYSIVGKASTVLSWLSKRRTNPALPRWDQMRKSYARSCLSPGPCSPLGSLRALWRLGSLR